ncbi:MAG: DUF366 family protein [Candidatus Krumholzibacteriia bacterium]
MEFRIIDEEIPYTGRELRSKWVEAQTGCRGDAAVAFLGPCHVDNADLVDLDDRRAGAFIRSESMAHVIVEHPRCSLRTAVLRQRLLVCLLCEMLTERGCRVRREGDDVYIDERKLTVSIAAPAPGSNVIHLGINVIPRGAPVPAVGLSELDIDPRRLLEELLGRYRKELSSCLHAEGKVRDVS